MKKALYGAGGQAKEIASLFDDDFVFIVDEEYANETCVPVSKISPNEYEILIAIGEPKYRKQIAEKLHNFNFFTLIHPTAIVASSASIGCGCFIGPYCVITNNTNVGNHSIVNRFNSIGHNSICGDYLSMMSSSVISGDCNLGECCYIGNNASIREKIKICDNIKIGMNAAVVSDIVESGVYAGVPAKRIK